PARGLTANLQVDKKNATIDQFGNIKINNVKQDLRTLHQTGVLAVNPNLPSPAPAVLQLNFAQPQDWSALTWLILRGTADFDLTSMNSISNGTLPQCEVVLGDSTPKTGRLDQSRFSPPLTRPVFHQIIDKGALKNVSRLKLETTRVELTTFGVD